MKIKIIIYRKVFYFLGINFSFCDAGCSFWLICSYFFCLFFFSKVGVIIKEIYKGGSRWATGCDKVEK